MENPKCASCAIAQARETKEGGVYRLGNNNRWMVNHYGGSEAILGWLALQPEECKISFDDLSEITLTDYGVALARVQRALRHVWEETFPDDKCLERIHSLYLLESEFDKHDDPRADPKYYHLHVHLVPRSQKIGKLIRRRLPSADTVEQYVPWEDYLIARRIRNKDDSKLVEKIALWDEYEQYLKTTERVENFTSRLWEYIST